MLLGEKHNPKPASFISTLVEAYDIFFLCLTSVNKLISRFKPIVANGIILFFLWMNSIPLHQEVKRQKY